MRLIFEDFVYVRVYVSYVKWFQRSTLEVDVARDSFTLGLKLASIWANIGRIRAIIGNNGRH